MSTSIAIKAEHVSKKFARSLRKAMWYGLLDVMRVALIPSRFRSPDWALRRKELMSQQDRLRQIRTTTPRSDDSDVVQELTPKSHLNAGCENRENDGSPSSLRPTEFWALLDVSFDVQRGECVGLIGSNGAGKSTLFKLISGVFAPSHGRITVQGRLTAMIEVGCGFHPMLSGRENIYISGSVLGMNTAEINRKFDEIVEFSGVREFIDMPVKFYSSGMHVRLGFAVLAHLDPEVMLIDEILAVGDMEFQRKCIERINTMRSSDMAIALVSHSLYRIESLCDRVVWIDRGRLVKIGSARDIVKEYRDVVGQRSVQIPTKQKSQPALLSIGKVELLDLENRPIVSVGYREGIKIRINYTAHEKIMRPLFNIAFTHNETRIVETSMLIDGFGPTAIYGPGYVESVIPELPLLPKVYDVELFIRSSEGIADLIEPANIAVLHVTSKGLDRIPQKGPFAIGHLMQGGVMHVDHQWAWSADIS